MTHLPPSAKKWPLLLGICTLLGLLLGCGLPGLPGGSAAREPALVHTAPPVPSSPAQISELAARIEQQRTQAKFGGRLTLLVEEAALPLRVAAHEPAQLIRAGSLQQLATAGAALEKLGPGFRFATELRLGGPVVDRVLQGPLIVRGGGDPTTSRRYLGRGVWQQMDEWARQLRAAGVKKIDGAIIGDGSAYGSDLMAPGWPSASTGNARFPGIGGLNFNHNCIEIEWRPGRREGAEAAYDIFPKLGQRYYFSNNVRVAREPKVARSYTRVAEGNLIAASGQIGAGERLTEAAAIADPALFYAQALRDRLERDGIKVTGEAASARTLGGNVPAMVSSLHVQFSPTLPMILRHMLGADSALEAEVLLRQLALRHSGGQRHDFGTGAEALGLYLDRLRIAGARRILTDGSGRSDLNRLTAEQLLAVLRQIDQNYDAMNLLPPPGERRDTTPETRTALETLLPQRDLGPKPAAAATPTPALPAMGATVAAPAAAHGEPALWAARASEPGVQGLAGLAVTADGRRYLFVLILNGEEPATSLDAEKLMDVARELTR